MEFAFSPYIFQIGDFGIRFYTLAYAICPLLLYLWLVRVAKYERDKVIDLVLYGFVANVIGARLGEVFFYHPEWIWENPLRIFKVWEGGLSFHGGLIAIVIWTLYFAKKQNWNVWKLGDSVAVPMAFVMALVTTGNFFNSELWGVETSVSWCFTVDGKSGCRHPSQLYQSLKNLIIGSVLLFVYYRPHRKGTIFSLFLILYGVGRTIIEIFWRDPDWIFWGITSGTWLSAPMIVAGLVLFFRLK